MTTTVLIYTRLAIRICYIKHPKSLVAEAVDDMQADFGFGVLGP